MRRLRRSLKRKIVMVSVLCLLQGGMLLGCYSAVNYLTVRKYVRLLEEKEIRMEQAKRAVYLTTREVKAGETFTEENTEKKYVMSEQNAEGLAVEVFGKIACGNLPAATIVLTSVCCESELSPTERECVYDDICGAEGFADGMTVDVRIRYDNGENYCVIQKKRLKKAEDGEEACHFFLTEEERLFMSGAQYDVMRYEGAELYLVGFREERLQPEVCNRYIPPLQVLMQLNAWNADDKGSFDERCVQREALEQRLTEDRKKRKDVVL